ncbi:carboxylic ester hydrolase [Bacillus spongiae]|uniref:Carboxylic ester hydrolase n=1 Tax=Bacillus spongiae TaxID=2683610 RepID=A0ABU8HIF8_9BACI
MRFWEILLVGVNFGLLYWVFSKRIKATSTSKSHWPLIVGILAVMGQVVFEGITWRMIPAYLTIVLIAAYLYVGRKKKNKRKWYTVTIQITMLTVYLASAILLPTFFPIFSLPNPTGAYSVGTVTYHWTDEKRLETLEKGTQGNRELMIQIWYPATEESEKEPEPYFTPEITRTVGIPLSHLDQVRTHSLSEASLSSEQERYPVLIYSHGYGSPRNSATFQIEELVSHGYIVVGMEHTYSALATVFPDGRTVINSKKYPSNSYLNDLMSTWKADATFVLDQLEELNNGGENDRFKGKLDLGKIGMFGHSFGGATSYWMLQQDKRVKAAINMDGGLIGGTVPEEGGEKPYFLMNTTWSLDEWLKSADQLGKTRESIEKEYYDYLSKNEKSIVGGGLSLLIPNSTHASFTDVSLLSPLNRAKGENPKKVHRLVREFTLAFFDQYVKGTGEPTLQHLGEKYPAVKFKVNH